MSTEALSPLYFVLFYFFIFLPCQSIYSNSPHIGSPEHICRLKANSSIKLHMGNAFPLIYLPNSLKKGAMACRCRDRAGALIILTGRLSSLRWLLFMGLWEPRLWARFTWGHLLIWRECGLSLGVTQTVTDGGVWRHLLVCFIVLRAWWTRDRVAAFQYLLSQQYLNDHCCNNKPVTQIEYIHTDIRTRAYIHSLIPIIIDYLHLCFCALNF